MLDDCLQKSDQCELLVGGIVQVEDRYVSPTVVLNPSPDSKLMEEEIFGPILPIIPFVDFQHDVIENNILQRGKPLAIYYFYFTDSKNF